MGLGLQLLVFAPLDTAIGLVMPRWMLIFYLFVACSELLLSPIGLSMISELSPKNTQRHDGRLVPRTGLWWRIQRHTG